MLTTDVLKLPEASPRPMMAHREGKNTSTMDMPYTTPTRMPMTRMP